MPSDMIVRLVILLFFFIIIINIYTYAGCFLLHKTERGEICVDCANMSENVGRQRICLGRL